jgi:NADH-quinone oxidoreductase subunit J
MMSIFDSGIFTTFITILGTCLWLLPNPIGSLLCFLSIVLMAVMFLAYIKIEFFAAVILLVYAGAIVVLLLFIIMFINFSKKNTSWTTKYSRRIFFISLFCCVICQKIIIQGVSDWLHMLIINNIRHLFYKGSNNEEYLISSNTRHIEVLESLYTDNAIILILLGIALLIAMLGAVYLTQKSPRY